MSANDGANGGSVAGMTRAQNSIEAELAAYESLSPKVRRALANAPIRVSPISIAEQIDAFGWADRDAIAEIKRFCREATELGLEKLRRELQGRR